MTAPSDQPTPAGTSGPPQVPPPAQHKIHRTRMGGLWAGLAVAAVVLLLLLVFILENQQEARIGFFGAHGRLPLGVALLLAAVGGALLVIVPGTARIIQLRRAARRHHRLAAAAAAHPGPPASPAPDHDAAPGDSG